MTSSVRWRALAVPSLLALVLGLATACSDDADDDPAAPDEPTSSAGLDDALLSGVHDPFELTDVDGTTYVVGHRVLIEIPSSWTAYGDEETTPDKLATVWSVGQPTDTKPFPAGLQFEMASPAGRNETEGEPLQRSQVLMEITPGYRLIESGEVVVPGAPKAALHRFENQIDVGGKRALAERIHLFINTGPRTWSTIRFIAPAGTFESLLKPVYDSVRITGVS